MSNSEVQAHIAADSLPTTWPASTREAYADLLTYRIVGASVCVSAIMTALRELAAHVAEQDEANAYSEIVEAGARFCALKPNTAAYVNAVRWLLAGVDEDCDATEIATIIARRIEEYSVYSQKSLDRILKEACSLLEGTRRVLIHDYSSTVLAAVSEAGRRGQRLQVFVTAGEPVGQGPKVAQLVADAGHHVIYLPDSGIGRVMEEVQIVLSGVETLFRNGDLANTVGTFPMALVARQAGVPLYGLTEQMKIHAGIESTQVTASDLRAEVLHPWPSAGVDLPVGSEIRREVLDLTPAEFVTRYVTEAGIIEPSQVASAADRFLAEFFS